MTDGKWAERERGEGKRKTMQENIIDETIIGLKRQMEVILIQFLLRLRNNPSSYCFSFPFIAYDHTVLTLTLFHDEFQHFQFSDTRPGHTKAQRCRLPLPTCLKRRQDLKTLMQDYDSYSSC